MYTVIGGTGFVGATLTARLVEDAEPVKLLVRDLRRAQERLGATADRVELVVGDMHDEDALDAALRGARVVYTLAQTVTARQPAAAGDFAQAELRATRRLQAAAERQRVKRLVAVGLIGADADARSAWVRSRAAVQRLLVDGPVEATVLRAGLVVGRGGTGFDGLLAAARRRTTAILGAGNQRWSYIALDDLVGYLVDAAVTPAAAGRVLDVGSDEAPTYRELVARTAAVLGRPAPRLVGVPLGALRAVAPLLERAMRTPPGGLRAAIEHLGDDLVADTGPARALMRRAIAGWEDAVRAAVPDLVADSRAVPPNAPRSKNRGGEAAFPASTWDVTSGGWPT